MKALSNLTETAWAEALGWALIHSLWQSLLIFLLCQIMLRMFARNSSQRYVIATASLVAMFTAAIGTFGYLLAQRETALSFTVIFLNATSAVAGETTTRSFLETLQTYVSMLTIFWISGASLFSVRLLGSWWYVVRIQRQAIQVGETLTTQLEQLITRMKIRQPVILATSSMVTAPVVIGWIKPTILVPIGFLSGLSTTQIETILVHELTHIKRHDYLINLVQSWIECILFFNPFVWIISNTIRIEREHCCDDAVVATSNAKVYALTLAQLEQRRLSASGMAVGLAENKHQLLNRIKRIMEKSVRNYSGKEKLIPVVLLITGLVCASWITFQPQEKSPSTNSASAIAPSDTTGKKNSKSQGLKRVITVNENGEANEETLESVDADDFTGITPVPSMDALPGMPALADVEFDMPLPPMPPADVMFWGDSVPPFAYAGRDWKEFSKAFEGKFKEQFADFYKKHQKDFDKMMQELETKFKDKAWDGEFQMAMAMRADEIRAHAMVAAERAEVLAQHQEELSRHAAEMKSRGKEMEILAKEHHARAKEMEASAKAMEANMKKFERELFDELVQDGYLKKDEKIQNIHWHNGSMEVNEVKIKDEHKKKYNDLHNKYFKEQDNVHYVH